MRDEFEQHILATRRTTWRMVGHPSCMLEKNKSTNNLYTYARGEEKKHAVGGAIPFVRFGLLLSVEGLLLIIESRVYISFRLML